jgi:hypothetical protein
MHFSRLALPPRDLPVARIRIRDSGSGVFWTPGSGKGKKSRSGSGMNIPDNISESLETNFSVKILKFFDADADPDPGIILIRDGINSDPGYTSRIRNTGIIVRREYGVLISRTSAYSLKSMYF